MKAYCESGGIAPRILHLGTTGRWVVSFTPQPLYRHGEAPGTHLIRGWVGPLAQRYTTVLSRLRSSFCTVFYRFYIGVGTPFMALEIQYLYLGPVHPFSSKVVASGGM